MALQKNTLDGVAVVVDSAAPSTPVTDVAQDGGDIIALNASVLRDVRRYRDKIFTVAASDSSAAARDEATYLCDGTADQVQIQAAIDAANAAGGGKVLLRAGTYSTSAQIDMKSYVWVCGEGWNTIVANSGTTAYSVFDYEGPLVITKLNPLTEFWLTDLQIDGGALNPSGGYNTDAKGVFCTFLRRCKFQNLYVKNTVATGIGIDYLRESVIDGCVIDGSGRLVNPATQIGGNGIGIGVGQYEELETLSITNCHCINVGNNGIMFEEQNYLGNEVIAGDAKVVNCSMVGCNAGARITGSINVDYIGCKIRDSGEHGVIIDRRTTGLQTVSTGVRFIGGEILDSTLNGVQIEHGRDIVFDCVTISGNVNGVEIEQGNTPPDQNEGIIFVGCAITSNSLFGVNLTGGRRITFVGCKLSSNGTAGIKTQNSSGAQDLNFFSCAVFSNGQDGIRLDSCSNAIISGCVIAENDRAGIFLAATDAATVAEYINITNNQIYNNGGDALETITYRVGIVASSQFAGDLNNVNILGNNIYDNRSGGARQQQYGIYLSDNTRVNCNIASNIFDNHVTGAINISGTAATDRIVGNTGYNPLGIAAIAVGASPFTYTAGPTPEHIYIRAGTVSDVSKNGTTIHAASDVGVALGPGESVVVSYSSAPTMVKDRL